MSGAATGFIHDVGKKWVASVAICTAIGGVALGSSWGRYSAHVVFNTVGVVTGVLGSGDVSGWINEGRNGADSNQQKASNSTPGQ